MSELMQLAVSTGLPEWDSDTIMAWMRQKHPSVLKITDGGRVRVTLSLDEYQRGDYQKAGTVSFVVRTPRDAAQFYPEIAQFRGVSELIDRLFGIWQKLED